MAIKNKATLVRRAKEHRELDHVARKTYGKINYSTNGETEVQSWQGCAISCLATESSIEGIINQGNILADALLSYEEDGRKYWTVDLDSSDLRHMLATEFNLCQNLIYLAEIIFEGDHVSDEYAEDWPLRFAQAIPEGVDITDEDIIDFWDRMDVIDWEGNPLYFNIEFDGGFTNIDDYFDYASEEMGEELIAWLESLSS